MAVNNKKTRKDGVHKRHRYTSSPLRAMGDSFKDEVDPSWTIVLAREPFWFNISAQHIADAVPGDARYCVVALALDEATGSQFDYQIGAGITKIFDVKKKIEVRFTTPGCLRAQIRKFDRPNGRWKLPPGLYRLNPMSESHREQASPQGKKKRKAKAAVHKFKVSVKKLATRIVKKKRAPVTRLVLRHGGIKRLAELLND